MNNTRNKFFAFAVGVSMIAVGVPVGATAAAQDQSPPEPPAIPVSTTPVGDRPTGIFKGGAGRSVEIPALRTQSSRTFQNDFGAFETEAFPGSIHYRANEGWRPIDNTLEQRGASVENRANQYRLQLPKILGAAPVRVELGNHFVALDLAGVEPVQGATSENAATYEDVLPGVDVRYEAQNDAVKEDLLLESATSTAEFTWRMTTSPSLTAQSNVSGGVDFVATEGSIAMSIPAPVIFDATGPADGLSPPHSFEIVSGTGSDELRLVVDQQWLTAPERAFPVTVDPTIYASGAGSRDCRIDSASPTTAMCGGSNLQVGTYSGDEVRALLRFDVGAVPNSAEVLNATLGVMSEGADSTGANKLAVRRVKKTWVNGEATWNRASSSSAWDTAGGDFSQEGFLKTNFEAQSGFKYWYITSMTKDWVAKGAPANDGVLIKAENMPMVDQRVTFSSMEGANPPTLQILWDSGGMGELPYYKTEDTKLTERRQQRVNVVSGNLLIHETDFKIKGLGLDLVFDRYYNGLVQHEKTPVATPMGTGWTLSNSGDVGLKLFHDSSFGPPGKGGSLSSTTAALNAVFFGPSGYRVPFTKSATNETFQRPPGVNADLRFQQNVESDPNDDRYILTFRDDETKYVFSGGGLLYERKTRNAVDDPASSAYQYNRLQFFYQDGDRVSSIKDSQGRVTTFSYYTSGTATGKLYQVTDPAGRKHTFTYNGQNLATYTDPMDGQTIYGYDGSGRLNKIRDAEGNETLYEYDASNRITAVRQVIDKTSTPPKEDRATFRYGNASSTYCPPSTPKNTSGHSQQVDSSDMPLMTTVADATQNAANPNMDVMNASAPVTRYCYGELGRVRLVMDQQRNETYSSYNSDANITSYIDARDKEFAFSYDTGSGPTGGNLIGTTGFKSSDGSGAETTSAQYENADHPGMPTRTGDAQGNKTDYKYDSTGNLTCVRQGLSLTGEPTDDTTTYKYTYNANGTLSRIGSPPHGTTTSPCDPIPASEAQGNDTLLTYFPNGNLQTIDYPTVPPEQPIFGDVSYTYDSLSRVQKVVKGNRQVEMWLTYDNLDRLTKIWYPLNGWQVTYTYDKLGNLVQRDDLVNGTNARSTYTYDQESQPLTESHPSRNQSGPTVVTTSYEYDPNGNLTKVRKAGESTTYTYDSVNVLKTIVEPDGASTTSFDHNEVYQFTHIRYPNGLNVYKTYNHSKKLKTLRAESDPAGLITKLEYSYVSSDGTNKDRGLLQKVTDTRDPNFTLVTTYTYDPLNRLTRAKTNKQQSTATTLHEEHIYAYDARGNLTHARDYAAEGPGLSPTTRDVFFAYNDANQLVCSWSSESCETNGTKYTYDPNGNLSTTNNGMSMTYDVRDRLKFAARPGKDFHMTASYLDETQEERVTRGRKNPGTGVEETTYMENDLLGLEREWTPNVETITYIRDNEGNVLGQKNADGSSVAPKRYYVKDHLGSIIATTDNTGNVKKRYSYDPYGTMTQTGTDTVYHPWRFAGRYYDQDAGLYKMGVRYYDPSLYRFTQMDPVKGDLGDPLTLNPYIYGKCDPVNNTDPTGGIACPSWLDTAATALNPLSSVISFGATIGTSYSFKLASSLKPAASWASAASTASTVSMWIGVGALAVDLVCT